MMHHTDLIVFDEAHYPTAAQLTRMLDNSFIIVEHKTASPDYPDYPAMPYALLDALDYYRAPAVKDKNPVRYCSQCGRHHKSVCVRQGRRKHFKILRRRVY